VSVPLGRFPRSRTRLLPHRPVLPAVACNTAGWPFSGYSTIRIALPDPIAAP